MQLHFSVQHNGKGIMLERTGLGTELDAICGIDLYKIGLAKKPKSFIIKLCTGTVRVTIAEYLG